MEKLNEFSIFCQILNRSESKINPLKWLLTTWALFCSHMRGWGKRPSHISGQWEDRFDPKFDPYLIGLQNIGVMNMGFTWYRNNPLIALTRNIHEVSLWNLDKFDWHRGNRMRWFRTRHFFYLARSFYTGNPDITHFSY